MPGGTTTTVNGSSMSAGPVTVAPAARRVPSKTGVSTNSVPKYAARLPVRARVGVGFGAGLGEVVGLRGRAPGDEPRAAQQRLLVAEAEAALALVLVVEPLGEIEQRGLVERVAFGCGHAHVEVLARVAHLREDADVDLLVGEPGRLELLRGFVAQLGEEAAEPTRSTCESGTT